MLSRSTAIAVVACTAAPQATAFVAAPLPVARLGAARSTATRPAVHALRATAAAGVNTASGVVPGYGDVTNVQLSGLNGKALKDKEFPSVAEVKKAMPEGTWVRDDKVPHCAYALRVQACDCLHVHPRGMVKGRALGPKQLRTA